MKKIVINIPEGFKYEVNETEDVLEINIQSETRSGKFLAFIELEKKYPGFISESSPRFAISEDLITKAITDALASTTEGLRIRSEHQKLTKAITDALAASTEGLRISEHQKLIIEGTGGTGPRVNEELTEGTRPKENEE